MSSQLSRLEVSHFRSHPSRVIDLGPVTAIIGPNGAGKTNLLEAVWFLATTRSFRTARESEMIAWGQPALRVAADDYEIRLAQEPRVQKAVTVRGVDRRPLEYLGQLRVILFTPDSLQIVAGQPADRRRFIDTLLSQRDQSTAQALIHYRRVVSQRNALLRLIAHGQAGPHELELWDQQLIRLGLIIAAARLEAMSALGPDILRFYRDISGQPAAELTVSYQPSAGSSAASFAERLAAARGRELAAQVTLIGPHRDDILISLNHHPAGPHASRGETRSIVLALKWAESNFIRDEDHSPVLLLDDLFSELDTGHRAALQGLLAAHQTICTTTDLANFPPVVRDRAAVVELS